MSKAEEITAQFTRTTDEGIVLANVIGAVNAAMEWAAQQCQAEADASNNLIRSTACLDCAELIRDGKTVSAETK